MVKTVQSIYLRNHPFNLKAGGGGGRDHQILDRIFFKKKSQVQSTIAKGIFIHCGSFFVCMTDQVL